MTQRFFSNLRYPTTTRFFGNKHLWPGRNIGLFMRIFKALYLKNDIRKNTSCRGERATNFKKLFHYYCTTSKHLRQCIASVPLFDKESQEEEEHRDRIIFCEKEADYKNVFQGINMFQLWWLYCILTISMILTSYFYF